MGAGILWVIAPSFAAHASPLRLNPTVPKADVV